MQEDLQVRAEPTSWKTSPLPGQLATLPYEGTFTAEEYRVLDRGLVPRQMEDKWFVFMQQDGLFFHRSWTGHFMYRVSFERVGEVHRVREVLASRDPVQHPAMDDDYEVALLDFLIRGLLLRQDVAFPVPVDEAAHPGIYQHHVAGTGFRQERWRCERKDGGGQPAAVIHFYQSGAEFGYMSNFAGFPIVLDGRTWPTSEHYFQAQKFAGTVHEESIRQEPSTMIAARMGRSRKLKLRADWEDVKDEVMRTAVRAKFSQHADLRDKLLATGEALLVERTENDSYWGDGGDGSGKNRLGLILMEIRRELRAR